MVSVSGSVINRSSIAVVYPIGSEQPAKYTSMFFILVLLCINSVDFFALSLRTL